MIVKALIKSVDYSSNVVTIRVPLFETAWSSDEVTFNATLINQPGLNSKYEVGDVVLAAFDNDLLHEVYIIGKVYLGPNESIGESSAKLSSVEISNSVVLPADTKLNFTKSDSSVNTGIRSITTLNDLYELIIDENKVITANPAETKDSDLLLSSIQIGKKNYRVQVQPRQQNIPYKAFYANGEKNVFYEVYPDDPPGKFMYVQSNPDAIATVQDFQGEITVTNFNVYIKDSLLKMGVYPNFNGLQFCNASIISVDNSWPTHFEEAIRTLFEINDQEEIDSIHFQAIGGVYSAAECSLKIEVYLFDPDEQTAHVAEAAIINRYSGSAMTAVSYR